MRKRKSDSDFKIFITMLMLVVIPTLLTLSTVAVPREFVVAENSSPYGYTWSLLLFVLPVALLGRWFWGLSDTYHKQKKAFLFTVISFTIVGFILDIVLGNTFFVFKNPNATLGINLPGYDFRRGWVFDIPLEEFLFYFFGSLFMLLSYIWSNLYWLAPVDFDDKDYKEEAQKLAKLVAPHFSSAIWGFLLIILAIIYKKYGDHPYNEGFPGYFVVLTIGFIMPTFVLFRTIKPFVNWRAFSLSLFWLWFISLAWEATLGVPYQWWGYQPEQMVGIFIKAWTDIPIEATFLWTSAGWGMVMLYEAALVYLHQNEHPRARRNKMTPPNYITDGLILPVPRGPDEFKSVKMANFIVKGDRRKLEAFCDKQLNHPTDGEIRYKPLFSHFLMTVADLEGYALNEEGDRIGWLSEKDLVFWIPMVALKRLEGDRYYPSHLVWFSPYIFIDNPFALAAGREIQGFPKTFVQFDFSHQIQNPELVMKVTTFGDFNPHQEGRIEWLAKIERQDRGRLTQEGERWQNGKQASQAIIQLLLAQDNGENRESWLDEAIDMLIHWTEPQIRLVFLKQFRSVEDSTKAGFQAITEVPFTITDFYEGGFLHGSYQLRINDLKDYPIAQELGLHLQNGQQELRVGFWSSIMMKGEDGTVVWKAKIA